MKDGTFKNKRNQSLDGYQASLVSMACNLVPRKQKEIEQNRYWQIIQKYRKLDIAQWAT